MLNIKRYIFLTIATIFIGGPVFAQLGIERNLEKHMLYQISRKSLYGEPAIKIEGSPYLSDEFQNGTIYVANGQYQDVPLRYNIFEDWMEYQANDEIYILDPEPKFYKFEFGDTEMVIENVPFKGKYGPGFLTRLDSGRLCLYVKHIVSFRRAELAKAMDYENKPATYLRMSDVFFYKVDGGELIQVPKKTKKLLKIFPDHQKDMSEYIKLEKLSASKPDELATIFKFYNGL